MIRHILFWNYTEKVKAEHKEDETLPLKAFRDHPLHVAHRERCKEIVTDRLCGDLEV